MLKENLFSKRKIFVFIFFLFLLKPFESLAFDFSLFLNSPQGEVFPGQDFQTAVSLFLLSKKSNRVYLFVSRIPPDVEVKFSPSSCKPPCSSILKIETKKRTLPGEYPLEILATGKGVTKTKIFSLKVSALPEFNFSIELSHSREEIWPGQTTYLVANLKHLSGSSKKVYLITAILPPRIKVEFSPSSCWIPCSSIIGIETSKKIPTGEYSFQILAGRKGIVKKADFKLIILSDLNSPFLISPKNKSRIFSLTPSFKWTRVEGAKFYIFEIDSYKIKTKKTFLKLPRGILKYHRIYTWKVKACQDEKLRNCSLWSESFKFKTITKKDLIKELKEKIAKIMKKIRDLQKQLEKLERSKI